MGVIVINIQYQHGVQGDCDYGVPGDDVVLAYHAAS